MPLSTKYKQLLRDKKFVIIYGTGRYGRIACTMLKGEGIDIACYAVSDGQIASAALSEEAVKHLSDIDYEPEDTIFVLTLNQRYWDEIQQKLNEKGYHYILTADPKMMQEYLEQYFRKSMNQKGINLEKEIVDFGILKVKNPLTTIFKDAFLAEATDLIFPYLEDGVFVSEGPYEIDNIAVNPNDIVIDCGANIGVFSTFAAQKGGKVFAFEPVPETRAYLQQNADLYPKKIHVEPYALSDEIGESIFYITERSGSNTLLEGFVNDIDQLKVPTITLDQFVIERGLPQVDFIKADIEGAERLMLAGAQETLRRFSPKLAICTYHLPDDKEVLENLIKQANPDYIVTHRWKKLYAYVPKEKRQQLLAQNSRQHREGE